MYIVEIDQDIRSLRHSSQNPRAYTAHVREDKVLTPDGETELFEIVTDVLQGDT